MISKLVFTASVAALSLSATIKCFAEGLPDAVDGVITVEGEVTVADSADVAKLAAASSIVLADGSTLSYTAPDALVLNADVSGSGVFSVNNSGAVTLSGDNSGLVAPGRFEFRSTPVVVTSETGLGGGASGEATFFGNVTNGMLRFIGENSVFTNYAPVVMKLVSAVDKGTFYFGSEAEDKYLVQAASFTASVDNYKTTDFYFKHNVEIISGTFAVKNYPYLKRLGDGVVRIGEDVDVVWGPHGQAIVYFTGLRLGCRNLQANAGLSPSGANDIRFERENCFGAETYLRPYVTWHNQAKWHFDLNGLDQTVARLEAIENVSAENQCAFIGTSSPAVLTAVGDKAGSQTARWKFEGPLSYRHDTAYTNVFKQYKLAATGALTISRGMVGFINGSGWTGNEVTVKAGGALSCASEASLDSGEHILNVESGGALEVAAGVTLKVRSAVFGSVTLPAGRLMPMNEVRSLTAGEEVVLTGDGNIQTAAGSVEGEWTGWPQAGSTDIVTIPDGVAVEITDDDIEKIDALTSIKAGVGARISCRTSVSPFVLKASLSGDVVFDARDCGTVVLAGDNSGIISPAGFVFSNTTVVVSNRFGLGGALTGPAHFYPAAPLAENRSQLSFGGEALTNDVKLVFHYSAHVGYSDPQAQFVQNADVEQFNGGSADRQRVYIVGDFTIAAPHVMNVFAVHQQVEGIMRIEEGAKLKANGNFGNGYYYIYGDVSGSLAIEQGMRRFIFHRENALSVGDCRFYDGSEKKFFFDLNGYNQTMPRVIGNQYGTTPYQQCFDVTSPVPATLTLNAGSKMNSGAAIRCLDQASLAYSGASTQTIGFATSTTSGSLTINSGAIAFERNAKWHSPVVTVNGGSLIVRPSASTNTFGVGRATETSLFVNGTGRLELQSGAYTSTVRTVTFDGKLLKRGVYSAENCQFITGEGALRAVSGRPDGVTIVVR